EFGDDITFVKLEDLDALIEAVELKEEQRANWFQMAQKLGEDLDAAEKRIAELEEAQSMHESDTLMLCRQFDELAAAMGWSSELAMQQGVSQLEYARSLKERIADLESRTVTVKLPPKIERNDIDGWFTYKGGRVGGGAAEWYNKALDDVGSELIGAGIKWEAE
ncbi:hypothetical protein ACRQN4_003980, partial [Klebsiella aerogenes]